MATWQPPIPKGAFVEAQALGAGLVLLGYCYDVVKGEGLIEINLHELCPVLGTSYASVRRWWNQMKELGIIERTEERGRNGVRAYFNPSWLDWRLISSPVSANKQETRSQMRSETSSPVSANSHAYKVLSISDQTRESEDQDRTRRALSPAVAAYYGAFPQVRLNQKQEAIITELVGEGVERLECWREVIQDYELSTNWKPENIGNMRSRFDRKWQEKRQKRPDERPSLPVVRPVTDRPDQKASMRALAEEARKRHDRTTQ